MSDQTEDKIKELVNQFGGDEDELLQAAVMDSVCPSICMNDDCDYTTEYEPDSREGWCEVCDTGTVKSLLVLRGLI